MRASRRLSNSGRRPEGRPARHRPILGLSPERPKPAGSRRRVFCACDLFFAPHLGMAEFAGKPTDSIRFQRVTGDHVCFGIAAFGAFELPMLETIRARCDICCFHPGGASGATRTLDRQQFGKGFCHSYHRSRGPSRKLKLRWIFKVRPTLSRAPTNICSLVNTIQLGRWWVETGQRLAISPGTVNRLANLTPPSFGRSIA